MWFFVFAICASNVVLAEPEIWTYYATDPNNSSIVWYINEGTEGTQGSVEEVSQGQNQQFVTTGTANQGQQNVEYVLQEQRGSDETGGVQQSSINTSQGQQSVVNVVQGQQKVIYTNQGQEGTGGVGQGQQSIIDTSQVQQGQQNVIYTSQGQQSAGGSGQGQQNIIYTSDGQQGTQGAVQGQQNVIYTSQLQQGAGGSGLGLQNAIYTSQVHPNVGEGSPGQQSVIYSTQGQQVPGGIVQGQQNGIYSSQSQQGLGGAGQGQQNVIYTSQGQQGTVGTAQGQYNVIPTTQGQQNPGNFGLGQQNVIYTTQGQQSGAGVVQGPQSHTLQEQHGAGSDVQRHQSANDIYQGQPGLGSGGQGQMNIGQISQKQQLQGGVVPEPQGSSYVYQEPQDTRVAGRTNQKELNSGFNNQGLQNSRQVPGGNGLGQESATYMHQEQHGLGDGSSANQNMGQLVQRPQAVGGGGGLGYQIPPGHVQRQQSTNEIIQGSKRDGRNSERLQNGQQVDGSGQQNWGLKQSGNSLQRQINGNQGVQGGEETLSTGQNLQGGDGYSQQSHYPAQQVSQQFGNQNSRIQPSSTSLVQYTGEQVQPTEESNSHQGFQNPTIPSRSGKQRRLLDQMDGINNYPAQISQGQYIPGFSEQKTFSNNLNREQYPEQEQQFQQPSSSVFQGQFTPDENYEQNIPQVQQYPGQGLWRQPMSRGFQGNRYPEQSLVEGGSSTWDAPERQNFVDRSNYNQRPRNRLFREIQGPYSGQDDLNPEDYTDYSRGNQRNSPRRRPMHNPNLIERRFGQSNRQQGYSNRRSSRPNFNIDDQDYESVPESNFRDFEGTEGRYQNQGGYEPYFQGQQGYGRRSFPNDYEDEHQRPGEYKRREFHRRPLSNTAFSDEREGGYKLNRGSGINDDSHEERAFNQNGNNPISVPLNVESSVLNKPENNEPLSIVDSLPQMATDGLPSEPQPLQPQNSTSFDDSQSPLNSTTSEDDIQEDNEDNRDEQEPTAWDAAVDNDKEEVDEETQEEILIEEDDEDTQNKTGLASSEQENDNFCSQLFAELLASDGTNAVRESVTKALLKRCNKMRVPLQNLNTQVEESESETPESAEDNQSVIEEQWTEISDIVNKLTGANHTDILEQALWGVLGQELWNIVINSKPFNSSSLNKTNDRQPKRINATVEKELEHSNISVASADSTIQPGLKRSSIAEGIRPNSTLREDNKLKNPIHASSNVTVHTAQNSTIPVQNKQVEVKSSQDTSNSDGLKTEVRSNQRNQSSGLRRSLLEKKIENNSNLKSKFFG